MTPGPGFLRRPWKKPSIPFLPPKRKGSGLGLAIVKNTIEAHQGRVILENGAQGGVAVRILLPRAATYLNAI